MFGDVDRTIQCQDCSWRAVSAVGAVGSIDQEYAYHRQLTHPLPLPTCTPADVARNLERMKRRDAERDIGRRLDVLVWNQQMEAAMRVILTADAAGHGIIIRTSHERNMIEAVAHETVERHTAYVFDYDRPDSGPFRKRLHIHTTPTQET